jgi:putative ubiquitin-RnfH superfamily antitoxin RatB of RatAB toxin-antitoxin module
VSQPETASESGPEPTPDASAAPPIHVEVVYALPQRVWRVELSLLAGSTVSMAVDAARLRERIPELADRELDLGIFNHPCNGARVLRDGDRVEIYRPLLIDPKDARRLRAAQAD